MTQKTVEISISFKKAIPISLLSDVMSTAFEGGIGYWAIADNIVYGGGEKGEVGEPYYQSIDLYDAEEPDTKFGTLTVETILLGIQRILTPTFLIAPQHRETVLQMIIDPENADYDIEDADCIVQAGMFNEIVYG